MNVYWTRVLLRMFIFCFNIVFSNHIIIFFSWRPLKPNYQCLALHFTINDVQFAEASVDRRMLWWLFGFHCFHTHTNKTRFVILLFFVIHLYRRLWRVWHRRHCRCKRFAYVRFHLFGLYLLCAKEVWCLGDQQHPAYGTWAEEGAGRHTEERRTGLRVSVWKHSHCVWAAPPYHAHPSQLDFGEPFQSVMCFIDPRRGWAAVPFPNDQYFLTFCESFPGLSSA